MLSKIKDTWSGKLVNLAFQTEIFTDNGGCNPNVICKKRKGSINKKLFMMDLKKICHAPDAGRIAKIYDNVENKRSEKYSIALSSC